MRIRSVRLIHFRNYDDEQIGLDRPFTALVGSNGAGKTNVLEAIHYLCLTRGSATTSDAQSVRSGQDFFSVIGRIGRDGMDHDIRCSFEQGKKTLVVDGKECRRFADHIGRFPLVQIAPQDISLIWDGGEERRRYFDQWISQLDRAYLEDLMRYHHFLKQSNALLRDVREGKTADRELLMLYRREMSGPAERIVSTRRRFIRELIPVLAQRYGWIAGDAEEVSIHYGPDRTEEELNRAGGVFPSEDLEAGRVVAGPHKDRFDFLLKELEIRKFGSQGQQKSFLVSMKLAGLALLTQFLGRKPVLLLDDIFDKMDDDRTRRLLELVSQDASGQVVLTDASPTRAAAKLHEAGVDHGKIVLEAGKKINHG